MTDEHQSPLSGEEIEDLRAKDERGKSMLTLLNTPGWTDGLRPYIENGKQQAMNDLMRAESFDGYLAHRQAFVTLDAIQKFIESTVLVGKAAHKKLFPNKGQK